MSIRKMILFLIIIACAVAAGYLLGQQSGVLINAQKKPNWRTKKFDLLEKLKRERIRQIKVLETDEDEFYAVIRETDEPVSRDAVLGTSDKLDIYDESGKAVYEHRDVSIESVEAVRFKPDSRQILIETNGGGTDNFLKIIEYRNGKFNDLINESETQLRGGYFTIPQYRSGNKTPYFNPAQLIVIRQSGGADENASAAVFRFQNNKFQKAGTFSMRDLGDLIEKQITQKK